MEGCKFDKAWMGQCREPTVKGRDYCKEHTNKECIYCGNQATHECERIPSNLVCGAPLCSSEECINRHNRGHGKVAEEYRKILNPTVEDIKNRGLGIIEEEKEKTIIISKDTRAGDKAIKDQCSRTLSFITFMHSLGLITEKEMLVMSGDITKQVFEDSIEEDK